MTQPPMIPMPPQPASAVGLDDLDDLAGPASSLDANWAENPDVVLAPHEASPDTNDNEIEAGVPAEPTGEAKKKGRGPTQVSIIDWTKATPRKADEFQNVSPAALPPTIEKIREFINQARANGWWSLYYPVLEYANRNSAQSTVTKINTWRNGKINRYGVRDGEEISARSEMQEKGKYVVWVSLLQAPESKADDRNTAAATPAAE